MVQLFNILKEKEDNKFKDILKFNPFLKLKSSNDKKNIGKINQNSIDQVNLYLKFLDQGIRNKEFNQVQLLNIKNILQQNRISFDSNNLQEIVDKLILNIDKQLLS